MFIRCSVRQRTLVAQSILIFDRSSSRSHGSPTTIACSCSCESDLVAENIDVAIRFGELEDSSVVATRIGKSIRYVVAAPEYLKNRKLPVEPGDLRLHDCVMLNARNNESDWDLVNGRKMSRVHVSGPISSRDFNSVSTFVYRGHGIGLLPSTYCDEALASGALLRLLPKWASPQIPVFAVYSNRKFLPLSLNVFLKALAAWQSPLWIKE
jgi:DNA-binding transcriptional LysR family regulator